MATYAAFKHVELYNVGKAKKRYVFSHNSEKNNITNSYV